MTELLHIRIASQKKDRERERERDRDREYGGGKAEEVERSSIMDMGSER